MAKEHVSMVCDCGNKISWIDDVTPGFRERTEEVIVCQNCHKKHGITYDGTLCGLKGAVVETEIETVDCPICKLSIEDIEKMTKEEAEKIALSDKLVWCRRHKVMYLTLRKKYSLMGKELLKGMID